MKKRVTVVGAGFSGLASAFYLVRAGFEVEIFEERERSGGLISTVKTPHGLVETAANGFLNSRFVEDLFTAVNVPMIGTTRAARRRYIFREGLCRRWPVGVGASLRVLGCLGRYFFDRTAIEPREGESVAAWSRRVLGEEASRYLVEAGLQGIYAGDPSRMSARLIVGRFFKRTSFAEHAPRSFFSRTIARFVFPRTRLRGTVAPPEGMGQLIAALEAYLRSQEVVFHFGRPASMPVGMARSPGAAEALPAHPYVVATNAVSAAHLLANVLPEKASLLAKVSLNPIVTTTAFFSSTDRATEGFGVLFPPTEHRRALGVLKNDFIFDRPESSTENDSDQASTDLDGRGRGAMSFSKRRHFSETWIRGGACAPKELAAQTDSQIVDVIVQERQTVFGLGEAPIASVTTRWQEAIPHYTLDLEKIVGALDRTEKNIFLMGNYLGDLGLAKILERASRLPERLAREGAWS